jgi:hypothetical protein
MGDKPVLGCVGCSHTIFRFLKTFCEDASRNKLRVSANFMILGATIQKLWVFLKFLGELWAGWACVGTNEKELTTCAKKGGQEEFKKNCTSQGSGTRSRPATSGCTPAVGRCLTLCSLF